MSVDLQKMFNELVPVTQLCPTEANEKHRKGDWTQYIGFCDRHEKESLAAAQPTGDQWPTSINFVTLPSRVSNLRESLQAVVNLPRENTTFSRVIQRVFEAGGISKYQAHGNQSKKGFANFPTG